MKCPYCGFSESKVIDSRPTDEGERIRRRRECLQCQKRFTTYEVVETLPITVVKKDQSREQFDREKLLSGIRYACVKRPISIDVLEKLADDIESALQNTLDREVTSKKIGELVMAELKKIDRVAYIRFASVYRHFQDVDNFEEEIKNIHE